MIVLFSAGLFLVFFNQISGIVYEKWLNNSQSEILDGITKDSIQDNLSRLGDSNLSRLGDSNLSGLGDSDLSGLGDSDVLFDYDAIQNIDGSIIPPSIDISNIKNAVGVITIPSVDLEEPILYGTTNQNLLLGATTMKPEQKMGEGNYTLAGHNHHTRPVLFQPIRNVEIGAEIHITDKDKVYTYKVINKEVVEPTRVDVLDEVEGKKLITLVSCYAKDGSDRIIVTGELHEVNDYVE